MTGGERSTRVRADGQAGDVLALTFPGRPEYLRIARLAAADTGARAGLSVEDLENLRIAVDELAYAIIGDGVVGEVSLRYACTPGRVEIEGSCPGEAGDTLALSDLALAIVRAVVDEYELAADGRTRRFRMVKRGAA
jgi:serine/threonine-protein kinase RsbW